MGTSYSKGVFVRDEVMKERTSQIIEYFKNNLNANNTAQLELAKQKAIAELNTLKSNDISSHIKNLVLSLNTAIENINQRSKLITDHSQKAELYGAYLIIIYKFYNIVVDISSTYTSNITDAIQLSENIKQSIQESKNITVTPSSFANEIINDVNFKTKIAPPPAVAPVINLLNIDKNINTYITKDITDALDVAIKEMKRVSTLPSIPTHKEVEDLEAEIADLSKPRVIETSDNTIEQLIAKAKNLPWKIPEVEALVAKAEADLKTKEVAAPSGPPPPPPGAPPPPPPGAPPGPPGSSYVNYVKVQEWINTHRDTQTAVSILSQPTGKGHAKQIKNIIKNSRDIDPATKATLFLNVTNNDTKPFKLRGGARHSRRTKPIPERQSYRSPRKSGWNSTRKNHRPMKGE
jgi:hypothetical protein